jgi:hypothetical protein
MATVVMAIGSGRWTTVVTEPMYVAPRSNQLRGLRVGLAFMQRSLQFNGKWRCVFCTNVVRPSRLACGSHLRMRIACGCMSAGRLDSLRRCQTQTFLILRCDPGLDPGEPRRTRNRSCNPYLFPRAEGRLASTISRSQSLAIIASFLARDQPLIRRSAVMASLMLAKISA